MILCQYSKLNLTLKWYKKKNYSHLSFLPTHLIVIKRNLLDKFSLSGQRVEKVCYKCCYNGREIITLTWYDLCFILNHYARKTECLTFGSYSCSLWFPPYSLPQSLICIEIHHLRSSLYFFTPLYDVFDTFIATSVVLILVIVSLVFFTRWWFAEQL